MFDLAQPEDIILSFITEDVTCTNSNNGSATVVSTGGMLPHSALWTGGPYSFTYNNLTAGSYEVVVTDARGCQKDSTAIVNQPLNPLNLNVVVRDISCYGLFDGYAMVNASGGTPDYDFQWFGMNTNSTDSIIGELAEGLYYLTVTDANSCLADTVIVISQPAPLMASYTSGNPSCIGNNDGYIDITIIGGSEPYTVYYDGFTAPFPFLTGLSDGTYYIEIIDGRDCNLPIGNVVLTENPQECVVIPNAFTPNYDGVNDTWIIENIQLYPDATIKVYNRWGQELWLGGPSVEWTGEFNGKMLPVGTYLYVIELFGGEEPRVGEVTIVY